MSWGRAFRGPGRGMRPTTPRDRAAWLRREAARYRQLGDLERAQKLEEQAAALLADIARGNKP